MIRPASLIIVANQVSRRFGQGSLQLLGAGASASRTSSLRRSPQGGVVSAERFPGYLDPGRARSPWDGVTAREILGIWP